MTGRQRVFVRLVVVAAGLACVALPALGAEKPTWARPGCAVAPATVGIGAAPVVVGTGPVDQGATATMSSGFRPDGSAYVRVAAGDLEVTKTVTRAGSFTIRLDRGDDTVLIHISAGALTVTRGTAVADVDLDTVDEEELLAVRSLLAGSRSVRALRVLGAGLAPGAERAPGGLALILTDAVVGFLDGDVSAVRRLAERLGRKRDVVRLVREDLGCYERWEAEVIRAWNDYLECQAAVLGNPVWRDVCSWRWVLWAESAWFAFLKCSGSPFIQQ